MTYGGITTPPATATGGYKGVSATPTVAPVVQPTTPFKFVPAGLPTSAPTPNFFIDQASSSFKQGVEGMDTILNPAGGTPAQGLEAALKVGAGVVGVASVPFAPVIAVVSKAIEFVGNKLSDAPAIKQFAATATPQDMRVLDALQNLGGIAMGILGVKAGEVKTGDVTPEQVAKVSQHPDVQAATQGLVDALKVKESSTNVQGYQGVKLPVTSETPTETSIPVKTGEESAPSEPYTPPEQLPTIQMGPKEPSGLPTIQANAPESNDLGGGLELVPEKPTVASTENVAQPSPETTPTEKEPSEAVPKTTRTTQTLKPIEGTGELKTRGGALSIEASAIEKGLTDNLGDLPEYKAVNFKEMAPKIADTFEKDPEGARSIAMGEKAAPKGTTPEMFAVTLEKEATLNGDVNTLRELANSKLTTAGTTMGQRIASYAQRDETSPVAKIQEVQTAREEALKAKGIDKTREVAKSVKEGITEVRKAATSRPTWEQFISDLTCKV